MQWKSVLKAVAEPHTDHRLSSENSFVVYSATYLYWFILLTGLRVPSTQRSFTSALSVFACLEVMPNVIVAGVPFPRGLQPTQNSIKDNPEVTHREVVRQVLTCATELTLSTPNKHQT